MPTLDLDIEVRKVFLPLFELEAPRFTVVIAHRRCGKTVASLQRAIAAAMQPPTVNARYGYIAPLRNQAKNVAWDLVKGMTQKIPDMRVNEAELRLDFPTGARVQLYGADNPDALRGGWLDGVILDEPAQQPPDTWTHVVRPMLADREGWAQFIGTPAGKGQLFDLWEKAEHAPSWGRFMFRASDTGYIPAAELEDARATMEENAYAQEFECSFVAAIRGAYWGQVMEKLERDGAMVPLTRDPAQPLYTAWDLGVSDATSIWMLQPDGGNGWNVIDYYENSGVGVDHYAAWLKEHGYLAGATHAAPHDIANTDWSSAGGLSRKAVAEQHGVRFERIPRAKNSSEVMDGINAVRSLLPRCRFHHADDERGARVYRGRLGLSLYRAAYNEKLGALQATPLHDWTSHPADAMRTFVGLPQGVSFRGHSDWDVSINRRNQSPKPRTGPGLHA